MDDEVLTAALETALSAALSAALTRGEALAVATVVSGPGRGNRMLIWPAGQALGSLGAPRLNQRAALYAEAALDRGALRPSFQSFDVQGQAVEVAFKFPRPGAEAEPRD